MHIPQTTWVLFLRHCKALEWQSFFFPENFQLQESTCLAWVPVVTRKMSNEVGSQGLQSNWCLRLWRPAGDFELSPMLAKKMAEKDLKIRMAEQLVKRPLSTLLCEHLGLKLTTKIYFLIRQLHGIHGCFPFFWPINVSSCGSKHTNHSLILSSLLTDRREASIDRS